MQASDDTQRRTPNRLLAVVPQVEAQMLWGHLKPITLGKAAKVFEPDQ